MKSSSTDPIDDRLRFVARFVSRLGFKGLAARIYLFFATRSPESTGNARFLCKAVGMLESSEAREKLLERFLDSCHPAGSGVPHGLPNRLVISLTSYPKRYPTLHYTLRCLLNQSLRPDRTVLWIAHEDKDLLPEKVLDLREQGLEIRFCDDLRSYKKILPILPEEPHSFIVTADDDIYYPPHWLDKLLTRSQEQPGRITAFLARKIALDGSGEPASYHQWAYILAGDRPPGELVFPVGVGGVVYPPGAFHPSVGDFETARRLAPSADDVWLYWMWRMNGGLACVVGDRFYGACWPGSQDAALNNANLGENLNDEQIRKMASHFGTGVFSPKKAQNGRNDE